MTDRTEAKGSCLCGTVRVTAKSVSKNVGACHCSTCRKWAGGPLLAVDCGTDITIEGEENITVFDSSGWAERGFCSQCGTHLFYRLKENKQYIMPAGLFDNDEAFVFHHQIFIDQKPGFYQFANDTEDMTGAEVFAKHAPPSE